MWWKFTIFRKKKKLSSIHFMSSDLKSCDEIEVKQVKKWFKNWNYITKIHRINILLQIPSVKYCTLAERKQCFIYPLTRQVVFHAARFPWRTTSQLFMEVMHSAASSQQRKDYVGGTPFLTDTTYIQTHGRNSFFMILWPLSWTWVQ